jgi:hypothetical protein
MTQVVFPLNFDTGKQAKLVSFGILAAAPIFLTIAFWAPLFIQDDPELVLLLRVVCMAMAVIEIPMALFLFRVSGAARGSIARHMIVVEPAHLMGFISAAPKGSFTPSQFSAVKLKVISSKTGRFYKPVLVGKDQIGTLMLESLSDRATAEAFSEQLARELGLPYERLV